MTRSPSSTGQCPSPVPDLPRAGRDGDGSHGHGTPGGPRFDRGLGLGWERRRAPLSPAPAVPDLPKSGTRTRAPPGCGTVGTQKGCALPVPAGLIQPFEIGGNGRQGSWPVTSRQCARKRRGPIGGRARDSPGCRCWRLYEFCRGSDGPDLLIRHVSSISVVLLIAYASSIWNLYETALQTDSVWIRWFKV
jgi:hypothetical protein